MPNNVLELLSQLGITVIAVITVAYAFIKWLGEEWLKQHFNQQLEAMRSQAAVDLAKQQVRFDASLDRATRLHDREFEKLPDIWSKGYIVYWEVARLVDQLQETVSFTFLTDEETEEAISQSGFSEFQKQQLREARDKNDVYFKLRFWKRFYEVGGQVDDFRDALGTSSIFLEADLRARFDDLAEMVVSAMQEARLRHQHPSAFPGRAAAERLNAQGKVLLLELEHHVRSRLWDGVSQS